jgi:AbrB family looped-hinge helix DNA binding protein
MRTTVSTRGAVVLPESFRRRLGIRGGDPLDIDIEEDRIVLTHPPKQKYEARMVKDPVTGFIAIDLGPDAPILTSEMVRELLTDFP